ncbi:hypothetical protein FISHEDRAFT_70506 [Fistulina hepatica ATCC 64428]|uniref:Uncharacterized protein n=1 Tax=Fistulina hepatica ATCC 64428 TaxID=1128425 RepID=A0A0D7AKF4_9AGAR|nr:hypothetical protein FISHEDRAFT_70506 [Fistulina hepatica ATCC 64428]
MVTRYLLMKTIINKLFVLPSHPRPSVLQSQRVSFIVPNLNESAMSTVTTTRSVPLHSPSKQIVGTPYDLSAPRFEYPFPTDARNFVSAQPTTVVPVLQVASPSHTIVHPKLELRPPPIPPTLLGKKRGDVSKQRR